MATKPTATLEIPGSADNYSFIPVPASSDTRGGIYAETVLSSEEFDLEVKVKDNGKAYVGHDEQKLDSKLDASDGGKFMKVDAEGNVVPVAMVMGVESSYDAPTRTLKIVAPGSSEVSVDSSLVTAGKAADAKATGEEIAELKARVTELESFLQNLVDASKQLY